MSMAMFNSYVTNFQTVCARKCLVAMLIQKLVAVLIDKFWRKKKTQELRKSRFSGGEMEKSADKREQLEI